MTFSWKLLLDRIPTRINIARRNIFPPDTSITRVLRDWDVRSSYHLFLYCDVARGVCHSLMCWLEFSFITSLNLFVHLKCWSNVVSNEKLCKGFWIIWKVSIWEIWNARNWRVINNEVKEREETVEEVKLLSLRWYLTRLRVPICLYCEWC